MEDFDSLSRTGHTKRKVLRPPLLSLHAIPTAAKSAVPRATVVQIASFECQARDRLHICSGSPRCPVPHAARDHEDEDRAAVGTLESQPSAELVRVLFGRGNP